MLPVLPEKVSLLRSDTERERERERMSDSYKQWPSLFRGRELLTEQIITSKRL